jgi:hypothetical protein
MANKTPSFNWKYIVSKLPYSETDLVYNNCLDISEDYYNNFYGGYTTFAKSKVDFIVKEIIDDAQYQMNLHNQEERSKQLKKDFPNVDAYIASLDARGPFPPTHYTWKDIVQKLNIPKEDNVQSQQYNQAVAYFSEQFDGNNQNKTFTKSVADYIIKEIIDEANHKIQLIKNKEGYNQFKNDFPFFDPNLSVASSKQ